MKFMITISSAAIGWILWAAHYAEKCITLKYSACANSSGWLETFEVLAVMGLVPLAFVGLIVAFAYGK